MGCIELATLVCIYILFERPIHIYYDTHTFAPIIEMYSIIELLNVKILTYPCHLTVYLNHLSL